jgi:DNA-binding SARP family transcriptional activator
MSSPTLRIQLLGEFRLLADNQPHHCLNKPRQQALLAYLLLHRHAPQPRQQLAFCFWPDSAEEQAFTNLRKLVFQLRQALPQADTFLLADHQRLGWRTDAPFSLDVAELEQALDVLEKSQSAEVVMVERVVALYRGELLPTCYDDWLLPLRRSLHEQVVRVLEHALVALEAQHEYQAGLRTAEHLLRLDPLHEASYRHLMNFRALAGDRAGALRVYHECATVLERELNVPPATETQALYHHLFQVESQLATAPALHSIQTALVGRQADWQALQQAWRQMAQRGSHLVVVWGEAGMGKTRLVEELLHWARLRPGSVAYTRAYALEGKLAYTPIAAWLRSEALRPVLANLEPVWLIELARLLPELHQTHTSLPPPTPMTESWQRQRFHEAVARMILGATGPRLLVVDDLQWCDAETLAWLHYLLRFDPEASLLVVGTVRSEAVDEDHVLYEQLRHLQREGKYTELTLLPLGREETIELAQQVAEQDITEWAEQLYQETEGNPLFVVEMVRAGLIKEDAQDKRAGALPSTVQAVIATRLAQLSAPARALAQLAATIGQGFTFDVLAAASDMCEDTLVNGLDELWRRRIVRKQTAGYDFSHDLIREFAYSQISQARRTLLHRRVAKWYQQNNCAVDAISHLLASRDFPHAASLIERTAPEIEDRGSSNTLIQWLHALPQRLLMGHPALCLKYARLLTPLGRVAEAEELGSVDILA